MKLRKFNWWGAQPKGEGLTKVRSSSKAGSPPKGKGLNDARDLHKISLHLRENVQMMQDVYLKQVVHLRGKVPIMHICWDTKNWRWINIINLNTYINHNEKAKFPFTNCQILSPSDSSPGISTIQSG